MNNSEDYPGWINSGVANIVGYGKNSLYNGKVCNVGSEVGVNTTNLSGTGTIFLRRSVYGKTQTEWVSLAIDIQVVLPLETPIELDLTPAQLTLLEGTNILTADGTINLTYLGSMASNVQSEIDEFESATNNLRASIAFVESTTAKTSHAVGDYIILNGIFCKVIAAISSGETLSFGTNIQATTIGAELRAIWAQISN